MVIKIQLEVREVGFIFKGDLEVLHPEFRHFINYLLNMLKKEVGTQQKGLYHRYEFDFYVKVD